MKNFLSGILQFAVGCRYLVQMSVCFYFAGELVFDVLIHGLVLKDWKRAIFDIVAVWAVWPWEEEK